MENPLAPWLDQVILGDCREVLPTLPEESIDLIFADPPYNLQISSDLWRPNVTRVDGVQESWDKFESLQAYDAFTQEWLSACRRVLKPTGTLWVIGTYHNIFRIGRILQDLEFWILNDIVWIKSNPMPNFRGVRFSNAHETLIWAQKTMGAKYTFNYHAMKALNEDLQMRSDWYLPICKGSERLKEGNRKLHPTQKPEALRDRSKFATTNPGDVVPDPFFGTGTTGAMAKKLQRHFIGIEIDEHYVQRARERVAQYVQLEFNPPLYFTPNPRKLTRVPFGTLVEQGYLQPGDWLFFGPDGETKAIVQADGSLLCNEQRGSIHQIARVLRGGPANGWTLWYYWDAETQSRQPIDRLRAKYRDELKNQDS